MEGNKEVVVAKVSEGIILNEGVDVVGSVHIDAGLRRGDVIF